MTKEEVEKRKRELNKTLIENKRIGGNSEDKLKIIRDSRIENSMLGTGFATLMSYTVSIGLLACGIIPHNIMAPALILLCSLGPGVLIQKVRENDADIKRKLSKFSSAKKEHEKLEEEIKYSIELEMAKAKMNIMSRAIDNIGRNNIVSDKEVPSLLQDKYAKLNRLITKKVLADRFNEERLPRYKRFIDRLVINCLAPAFMGTIFMGFPFLCVSDVVNVNFILVSLLSMGIITTVAGTFAIKKNSDYQKVFTKFNNSLADDALEVSLSAHELAQESKQINHMIEDCIIELSNLESSREQEHRYLESSKEENKGYDKEIIETRSYSQEPTKTNKLVLKRTK